MATRDSAQDTNGSPDFADPVSGGTDPVVAKKAEGAGSGDNLDELEAFLDQFEKNLDPSSGSANAPAAPQKSAPPRETPPDPIQPPKVERAVQGLIKEEELNLDDEEIPPVKGPSVDEFVPEPPILATAGKGPATPAAAPAARVAPAVPPAPQAVRKEPSGGGERKSILTPLLLTLGIAVSFTALWFAWSARSALDRLARETAPAAAALPAGADPRVQEVIEEVIALRDKVGALEAKGAESDPSSVQGFERRLADLEALLATRQPEPEPALPAAAGSTTEPAATPPGIWGVYLASFDALRDAEQELARIKAKGIEAQIATVHIGGKTWHRVMVGGFRSAGEARAFVSKRASSTGFGSPWIGKVQ